MDADRHVINGRKVALGAMLGKNPHTHGHDVTPIISTIPLVCKLIKDSIICTYVPRSVYIQAPPQANQARAMHNLVNAQNSSKHYRISFIVPSSPSRFCVVVLDRVVKASI